MKLELRHVPFDGHVHFRDPESAMFEAVVRLTVGQCWGAVVMPNTSKSVTNPEIAGTYGKLIQDRAHHGFEPVMTGYLTADMDPGTILRGWKQGRWKAMKFYPRGATTNSHAGLLSPMEAARSLEVMETCGMPLLIHPEVNIWNGKESDPYDREFLFLNLVLPEIRKAFPGLRISLEHITTRAAVEYMESYGRENRLVCTVTPHHLLINRKDFFRGGPNPHLHCWPVPKREEDQEALIGFIGKGHPFVFAGSDSAPHPTTAKERACACAGGVFTAHAMAELYAEAFDRAGALQYLDAFLGEIGPRFYGLESRRTKRMWLEKTQWTCDKIIDLRDGGKLRPFGFHENPDERRPFAWKLHDDPDR